METDELKQMIGKRPDELDEETRKLFDAIISIADERDLYKEKLTKIANYINHEANVSSRRKTMQIIDNVCDGDVILRIIGENYER